MQSGARRTYPEQSTFHVEGHFVVVEIHYPHQTLKRDGLEQHGLTLRRLAHDLHDVVAFSLQNTQHARTDATK